MSRTINTLQDALSYQLQGLLYTENIVNEEFKICNHYITSPDVKTVIKNYLDHTDDVKLKLDRIFNYLMLEPFARKNEVINKMIDETQHLLTYTSSSHLKDIMMIGCIKNVNAYKTASYQTSYLMAAELELDTASDLVQQILEWETATGRLLDTLSIREFNKINKPINTN